MRASPFLFTIMILFTQLASGQLSFPVKKIHAFFEPVTSGVMSKDEARHRQQKGNYLIYITSRSEAVKINNVWINGERYHAELQLITSPVLIRNGTESIALPKTTCKTYQLKFTALTAQAVPSQLPGKYSASLLVLEFQHNHRKRFVTVDAIKVLETTPLY